ncbi:MAG: hypothetical protein KJZ80_13925 [Hyphomicrobiaceae bacterium]|nr:hypothetical protein [Hyphomicrobiaceae bacterium]
MSFLRGPDGLLRREYSLAALLGIVTLVSILPFLLVGIYGLAQYVAGERADQLDRMAEYTKSLAGSLDRELSDQLETTDVVAASRHLAKGDLSDFGALARDAALKAHGHFVLVAPSGQQLVNTRLAADVSLPHTEDMESLRKVLQTGRPAVSELFIGAVSNQLLYVARVPVEVGGEIRYVLSFEPHGSAVLDVVQQTYLPDGWRASVIDGNGRIVARTFRHEELYGKPATREFFTRLAGPNGIVESTDLDGQEVVASYQRSALSNWRILIWAPKSVLYAGTYRVVLLVVGLAALTVLVSFAAALLAGRVIGGPARQLLGSARALGEGNPVHFGKTHMQEANVVGHALAEASRNIAAREQTLRKSEQHTRFLMRELSHRAKNLLAVVQAIARQTGRSAENIGEFNERLGERLAGLARSHDLLVKKSWEGVPIAELVAAQLAPFIDTDRPRVATSGPPLLLGAEAAQSLGMALHELATNASKHGALSVPAGRVDIEWAWHAVADDVRHLQVRWKESNGPPVTATPTRKGFGHAVIEGMAAASLDGTAKLDWRPEGLVWTLDAPESSLGEPSEEGNG